MALTLTITSGQADALGANASKSFSAEGGSIGRSTSCDWVLPDPERFISGQHAQLSFRDGAWQLTDTSSNGVFVNRADRPVGNGNKVTLNPGDLISIGEYSMQVDITVDEPLAPTIPPGEAFLAGEREPPSFLSDAGPGSPESSQPLPPADLGGDDFPPLETGAGTAGQDPWAVRPPQRDRETGVPSSADDGSLDPLAFLGGEKPEPPLPADSDWPQEDVPVSGSGAQEDHAPGTESFFQPPAAHQQVIPDDWDDDLMPKAEPASQPAPPAAAPPSYPPAAKPVSPAPPPASAPPEGVGLPTTAVAAPVAPGGDALLRAFLRGVGLPEDATLADDPEQALEAVGSVFRAVVQGLMAALMARTSIKGEFRMEQTSIRPKENNPLKFSVGVDEALHNLLLEQGERFLQPVDAFKEGFQDIKDHQMATMAGMRASYEAFLVRLSPRNVQQHAGKGSKLEEMLGGARKAKLWDAYEGLYDKTLKDVEDDFQRVVGEAFARAYDEQIRLLARARRRSR